VKDCWSRGMLRNEGGAVLGREWKLLFWGRFSSSRGTWGGLDLG
jgi:hypothetical protein